MKFMDVVLLSCLHEFGGNFEMELDFSERESMDCPCIQELA